MKKSLAISLIAIIFIWVGMLCGISFLEAPLKFQAPGITLQLGLGVGKLVFGALTKIEMAFSLLIISFLLFLNAKLKTWMLFFVPILVVILDNTWLMPILDARIDMIVSGISPPESKTHWWYVALEFVKLVALLVGGVTLVKRLIPEVKNEI